MKHILYTLGKRYPQIYLPIEEGISNSEEYEKVCYECEEPKRELLFSFNEKDKLETINTECGDVDILTLYDRNDFEHIIRSLAFKCEPKDIPKSTGAMALFGLNNIEKFKAGLDNYKDSFLILSSGDYSNVNTQSISNVTNNEVTLSQDEWTEKSITIRKYHELTHFIMRKTYPNNIDPVRDEIIADSIGLMLAFKKLDVRILKLFLGLEGETYRKGGRLENYKGGDDIEKTLLLIDKITNVLKKYETEEINNIWQHIKEIL